MNVTKSMNWQKCLLLLVGALCFLFTIKQAQAMSDVPDRPSENYYDQLDVLNQDTKDLIVNKNRFYTKQKAKPQVMVALLKEADVDSDAPDLFSKWGLGQRDADNGVLILYALNDGERNVRIEVGYGLEDTLTDSVAGRILADNKDKLKSADPAEVNEGLENTFKAVATIVDKKYNYKMGATAIDDSDYDEYMGGNDKGNWITTIISIIIFIFVGVIFFRRGGPRNGGGSGRGGNYFWYSSGSGSSWNDSDSGFGGGGGFSGGGGSSGGGGASI